VQNKEKKRMNSKTDIIKDYMGIFPKAATQQYCEDLIKWFEYNNKEGSGGGKNTVSRQELENGISKTDKDSEIYWLGSHNRMLARDDILLAEFNKMVWKAYDKFKTVYGAGLDQLGLHKMSPSVKIQRYQPTQGYHVWHPEVTNQENAGRVLVCLLYLNTVEEGGETEFLYQKMRVPAVQGTLAMFPTTWTHLHRGNPPLKGNKYVINTWLEFVV
jgi:hypothetical protein|tara:strand:+ start:878 stop:1522 length:645 start_codon:yes stop_codon:yes gene_type:complete